MQVNPRKKPRQQRAASTVAVILDAATRVLQQEGLVKFNTNRVADVAGVSVGSLYQYFPSKHALIAELACREYESMLQVMQPAFLAAMESDVVTGVRAIVQASIDGMGAYPGVHRLLTGESLSVVFTEPVERRRQHAMTSLMTLAQAHSRRHQAPHITRPPELTAALCVSICRGLLNSALAEQSLPLSRPQLQHEVASQLLFALGHGEKVSSLLL